MMTRAMIERLALTLLILSFLFVGMFVSGMIGKARSANSTSINNTICSKVIDDRTYKFPCGYFEPYQPQAWPVTNNFTVPIGKDLMINLGKPGAYVTIKANGTVIYGDDYDPDVTAKAFWESLGERRNCK